MELAAVVRSRDQNPSDADIANMVRPIDADGNESIDFLEFLSIMATISASGGGQMLIDEFRAFDKNVDGLISAIELKYVVSKLS